MNEQESKAYPVYRAFSTIGKLTTYGLYSLSREATCTNLQNYLKHYVLDNPNLKLDPNFEVDFECYYVLLAPENYRDFRDRELAGHPINYLELITVRQTHRC